MVTVSNYLDVEIACIWLKSKRLATSRPVTKGKQTQNGTKNGNI
jgi:hypothetical protein